MLRVMSYAADQETGTKIGESRHYGSGENYQIQAQTFLFLQRVSFFCSEYHFFAVAEKGAHGN